MSYLEPRRSHSLSRRASPTVMTLGAGMAIGVVFGHLLITVGIVLAIIVAVIGVFALLRN